MVNHPDIPIVIDTREQDPLDFRGLPCTTEIGTVPVFDYCLKGDTGWAIERKSLHDFVGSITGKQEIKDREFAKIRKAKEMFDAGTSIIYVVEAYINDLRPERTCSCVHQRASMRCPFCHGRALSFCECIRPRPDLRCEWCGGSGVVGYNYQRRRITPQFTYHQLSQLLYTQGVTVLFAGTRLISACMIEAMLRRRYEWLSIVQMNKVNVKRLA